MCDNLNFLYANASFNLEIVRKKVHKNREKNVLAAKYLSNLVFGRVYSAFGMAYSNHVQYQIVFFSSVEKLHAKQSLQCSHRENFYGSLKKVHQRRGW